MAIPPWQPPPDPRSRRGHDRVGPLDRIASLVQGAPRRTGTGLADGVRFPGSSPDSAGWKDRADSRCCTSWRSPGAGTNPGTCRPSLRSRRPSPPDLEGCSSTAAGSRHSPHRPLLGFKDETFGALDGPVGNCQYERRTPTAGVVIGGLDPFVLTWHDESGRAAVSSSAGSARSYMPRSVFVESRTLVRVDVNPAAGGFGHGERLAVGQGIDETCGTQKADEADVAYSPTPDRRPRSACSLRHSPTA